MRTGVSDDIHETEPKHLYDQKVKKIGLDTLYNVLLAIQHDQMCCESEPGHLWFSETSQQVPFVAFN